MDIELKNLTVKVKDKTVLDKLNLNIKKGEIHALMGPNGVGKSTLSKIIMAHPDYEVTEGDILVDNKSILGLSTDERARLGIFLSFQNPVDVSGVTNQEFLKMAINSKREEPIGLYDFIKELEVIYKDLDFPKEMMHRFINDNFSGGEKKKNEIIQMKALKPKFIILDELDSGLDVDSLDLVCKSIMNYYKEEKPSLLLITHHNKIFEKIKPDFVHIIKDGSITLTGDVSLGEKIEESGYKDLEDNEMEQER